MGGAILKMTRLEAIKLHQTVMDLHTIMRRHAILDVFAEAADRHIELMRDEIQYLEGISDDRFQDWIGNPAPPAEDEIAPTLQVMLLDSPHTGPMMEVFNPAHGVQIQVSDKRAWVNVDGICRMRVSNSPRIEVKCNGIKLTERKENDPAV